MMPPLRIAQTKVALVDPHDCTDAADALTLLQALCDCLVRRQGAGFVPRFAQSWTVSDDACHFTFVLRPGLVFHDAPPPDGQGRLREPPADGPSRQGLHPWRARCLASVSGRRHYRGDRYADPDHRPIPPDCGSSGYPRPGFHRCPVLPAPA